METKNVGLYIGLSLCVILALPNSVDANDFNRFEVNFVENNSDEVHIKNSDSKDPLKNNTISLDKIFILQADNSSLSKTNIDTKSLDAHLTRIRNKFYQINTNLQISSNDYQVLELKLL